MTFIMWAISLQGLLQIRLLISQKQKIKTKVFSSMSSSSRWSEWWARIRKIASFRGCNKLSWKDWIRSTSMIGEGIWKPIRNQMKNSRRKRILSRTRTIKSSYNSSNLNSPRSSVKSLNSQLCNNKIINNNCLNNLNSFKIFQRMSPYWSRENC